MSDSDIITQLQDEIDKLAMQFYSALHYINQHHALVPFPDQPEMQDPALTPDEPALFEKRRRELAQDLMIRSKQIEALIDHLPGIGKSEHEQLERIHELERQLERENARRQEVLQRRNMLESRLEDAIAKVAEAKMQSIDEEPLATKHDETSPVCSGRN